MKKLILTIIILLLTIFSAKAFAGVISNHQSLDQVIDSAKVKTRDILLESKEAPSAPKIPDSIQLDVPLLNQMDQPKLYNGCEVTSLAMMLNFHGVEVTKNELANNIKTVPLTYNNGQKGNPHTGFVGDMVNGPGLGVYNEPVLELAQKYVGDKAVNLTNRSFSEVLEKVGQGLPVWIITTTTFAPVSAFETWDTPQGQIDITFSEHSVVITGYDANYIYINDPYGTKNKKLDRENFTKAWEQMGKQAIVIEK
ncbi:C39 family peptidase [Neobacillus jeddahensis]|uniref:C39 family peptidase n=1 Tax=Neobacillus jeddahensis TaxID=1461580 RepID=UPI00058E1347|nr:C39 family peptidase [Neobacillus jeddahensis]